MIQYEEALKQILNHAKPNSIEQVELQSAKKRILAEDICYDLNVPPFDKSAMDGYACRREDIGSELELIEVIYAGKQPEKSIGPGQCAKIMTGAVVPSGATLVFMKEDAIETENSKIKCANPNSNLNICYTGEDAKKGSVAISALTQVLTRHLPIIASTGTHRPLVYCTPKVAVVATGTELVEPDITPQPHQIRNSNSTQVLAQLDDLGINGTYMGIVKDSPEVTENTIKKGLVENDVLILSGGVSVGDFDFIPETLTKLGMEIIITETAIQPGKPMVFAVGSNKYCFGLSGNPVSSFIQFELYVKPFLYAMMNYTTFAINRKATLAETFRRKKAKRLLFVPAFMENSCRVHPVKFNGSAHIGAFAHANCLIEIPMGVFEISEGEEVNVRPI